MHEIIKNLESVKHKINEKIKISQENTKQPTIIAISKTFSLDQINPLIEVGHIHFGENKVQEAEKKWDKTLINKHHLAEEELNKHLKYFIQVNLGNEVQKSGVPKNDLKKFIQTLQKDFKLDVIGLMCLPPQNEKPEI